MALNPDQFHEHLDRLSEATGLQYGPNSISTRSGLVLPAMHEFNYSTRTTDDTLRSHSRIPDERGNRHGFTVEMNAARGDEISSFGFSTVEQNKHPNFKDVVSSIGYSQGSPSGRLNAETVVNSPEEMLEKFRSTPLETSERTVLESKRHFDRFNEYRKEAGVQPGESEIIDWRRENLPTFAYDFRSRSTRPIVSKHETSGHEARDL